MFPSSRKRRGTSSNGVGSQTDGHKRFVKYSRNVQENKGFFFDVWVWESTLN